MRWSFPGRAKANALGLRSPELCGFFSLDFRCGLCSCSMVAAFYRRLKQEKRIGWRLYHKNFWMVAYR